ncbi:MAG TPA: ABC transporter ATP-binding protein [Epsilonproteobacteria bacterium]|nr:ABC transporter ATP-binding protein [Campylobacterota bacterium]
MNNVLEVKNISKSFKDYSSEWARVFSWFGLNAKPLEEHHILKHISFNIAPGEAVGIVGQNGAGKSTLLKIITGTLKPSEGYIHINGRISAILELGMGFHPDLTGRQNVYHSAGLMGFTHEQIDAVMNDIEEFAEIGEYFDQPVRTYSSGMQMRVAFGVATMYRPEMLIVDEALSVGDAYFQHKSFERIREFQEKGTTLLIVSHDRGAIQAICDRAILIEKGAIIKDGDPEVVMDFYNALIAEKENSTVKQLEKEDGKIETISGTGEATVEEIGIYDVNGGMVEFIGVGDPIELRIKVKVHKDIESLVLGYGIKDRLGQVMYGTNTWHTNQVLQNVKKNEIYNFTLSFPVNFGVGSYSIQTALVDKDTHLTANYEWKDLALVFNVINIDKTHFAGCNWNEPKIEVKKWE